MKRVFLGGIALLLSCDIAARSKSATPSKDEQLVFVFLRVDRDQHLAILRPVIAPDIGVQLDSGSPKLETRTVLRCRPSTRELDALVENEPGKITELVLDCGDRKFVVKGLDFTRSEK
jgi:hypothetical protein